MAGELGVAVDLGATRVRVCVGSKSGRLTRRQTKVMIITPRVEDYLKQIVQLVRQTIEGVEAQGVCVASPGPLDLKRGMITGTANLPYREVPIVQALQDALGADVHLMNDANAAALGEWRHGAGKGLRNVFYLTISTGIGGGAVVDGRLLLGKEGNAAEVGHVTIDSQGELTCGCGRKGHWEAYCSGTGIPKLAELMSRKLTSADRRRFSGSWLVGNLGRADAPSIFRSAATGDSFAERIIAEVGRLNAIGVANVTDSFDPELVTIGGGVALNNPEMVLAPIRSRAADYAINRVPEIRITPLGDEVGLLGALSAALDPSLIGESISGSA
jgi:glucokinase